MEFNFWIFTFEENSDLELCFNEISYQVIQILDWVIFPDFQHSVFCQKKLSRKSQKCTKSMLLDDYRINKKSNLQKKIDPELCINKYKVIQSLDWGHFF